MRFDSLFCLTGGLGNLVLVRLAILCSILFLLFSSCAKEDETEKILRLIKQGAELAEKQDALGLMEFTTEDFVAQPGQHGNQEVRRILWLAFRHYRNFRIIYPEPKVELEGSGNEATARVYFLIVRKERSFPELQELYKNPQRWLEEVGENADLYRLQLALLKQNENWLVRRAILEPYRGVGFGE
jgi:hypothetical protein